MTREEREQAEIDRMAYDTYIFPFLTYEILISMRKEGKPDDVRSFKEDKTE